MSSCIWYEGAAILGYVGYQVTLPGVRGEQKAEELALFSPELLETPSGWLPGGFLLPAVSGAGVRSRLVGYPLLVRERGEHTVRRSRSPLFRPVTGRFFPFPVKLCRAPWSHG